MRKRPFLSLIEMFRELKRREVYPVLASYVVVAWILLQIGEVTFAPMGLPDWAMTGLIVVVILGLPVALILAWVFDITPTGIHRDSGPVVPAIDRDDLPSIAVLPFVDISPDKDQGYFCEGVAEEILNALARIRELRVAARSSSFQYREGTCDARSIGKELGVGAILEGSVRKSEDRLRVTVQLVKVADGFYLWSKSFDEESEDIFAIQDEIATSIANTLLGTIKKEQMSKIKATSCKNVHAYEYYLRGRQYFSRSRKLDIQFALQMFRQAIVIDPECIVAWTGYADCYSFLYMYVDAKDDYRAKANDASERALELSPELAEAHASRGLAFLIDEKFEPAEKEFKKALELNPTLCEAYYYYGRAGFHQGNTKMAAELFEKAAQANPSDYQSRFLRVQILRGMGRTQDAVEEAKKGIAIVEHHLKWSPDDIRALQLGAGSLILIGEIERGKRWLRRALEIDPNDSVLLYNVACHCATMGDIELSLNYLEKAIENGTVNIGWIKHDEDLRKLRGHPRYERVLKSLADQRCSHRHPASSVSA